MATTTNRALPEWATVALNGGSHRKPELWKPEPGDVLAGEIVECLEATVGNSKCTQLVVRAEGGSQSGEPLEPGSWIAFNCTGSVLRHWVAKESPQPGVRVAVECRGRNGRWSNFVAGVYREAEEAWS